MLTDSVVDGGVQVAHAFTVPRVSRGGAISLALTAPWSTLSRLEDVSRTLMSPLPSAVCFCDSEMVHSRAASIRGRSVWAVGWYATV